MSVEPTISCPKCHAEIKLTESLAAPLVESTRLEYEKRIADKNADFAKKEAALKQQSEALEKAEAALDEQVTAKLKLERDKIVADEAKKARRAIELEWEVQAREKAELEDLLKERTEKLAKSQEAEAELKRKERLLEDREREMNLTIEKRVAEEQQAIREKARRETEDELRFTVAEKEVVIASMKKQIDELQRKAEQGSQQLQGEVLELELERLLSSRFQSDTFVPVAKGDHGGDVLHHVNGATGRLCGTILWESKRTKNWVDGWLTKLRDDQRTANADIAVIVTQALPKQCDSFDFIDGVWVTHWRCAYPVALSLRQTLIDVASARQAFQGQHTKMELIYQYLTGPRFRQRLQAMAEVFETMQEDLDKERKAILKQWEKRRGQIDRILQATAGLYGDLQGIAGQSILSIDELEWPSVESRALEA